MPSLSEQQRERLRKDTRDAAGAFVEDMEYLREVTKREETSKREVRHLSGTLRKMIVDRDIAKIATPRLNKRVMFLAPDNRPWYRASEQEPYLAFVSGGAEVLGGRIDRLVAFDAPAAPDLRMLRNAKKRTPAPEHALQTCDLNIDQFAQQRVVCWRGRWITRQTTIKYLAEISSGVHSDTPTHPDDVALAQMRSSCHISLRNGGFHLDLLKHGLDSSETSIDYDPSKIDFVLIEVIATATFITISPVIHELEAIVRRELGLKEAVFPSQAIWPQLEPQAPLWPGPISAKL